MWEAVNVLKETALTKPRIFTIVEFRKFSRPRFLAPHLRASPPRVISEVGVALIEVPVNRGFRLIHRLIVTVLNYGARHTAENRFDHVEELSSLSLSQTLSCLAVDRESDDDRAQ